MKEISNKIAWKIFHYISSNGLTLGVGYQGDLMYGVRIISITTTRSGNDYLEAAPSDQSISANWTNGLIATAKRQLLLLNIHGSNISYA